MPFDWLPEMASLTVQYPRNVVSMRIGSRTQGGFPDLVRGTVTSRLGKKLKGLTNLKASLKETSQAHSA